jgi:cation diffusion facilitator family transporter
VADESRPRVLTARSQAQTHSRAGEIGRVLVRVLVLNLLVAVAKIAFGYWTGAVSILSDGFHSLTDSASNVMALVGIRVARQPADHSHPYGHRKFETLAAAGIFVFLLLVLVQVLQRAVARFESGEAPEVTGLSFAVMIGTLLVNLVVVRYEAGAGRRLQSEVLKADAHHTRSDVYTSLTVIAALVGVTVGWPLLDPLAAVIVAGFIGHAGYEVAREASGVLADQVVLDAADVTRVVRSVPEVVGCHQIRTRGSIDYVFLDLHVWFPADMRLDEAHRLSHVVKDRLVDAFPGLADVVIHIEPPNT